MALLRLRIIVCGDYQKNEILWSLDCPLQIQGRSSPKTPIKYFKFIAVIWVVFVSIIIVYYIYLTFYCVYKVLIITMLFKYINKINNGNQLIVPILTVL